MSVNRIYRRAGVVGGDKVIYNDMNGNTWSFTFHKEIKRKIWFQGQQYNTIQYEYKYQISALYYLNSRIIYLYLTSKREVVFFKLDDFTVFIFVFQHLEPKVLGPPNFILVDQLVNISRQRKDWVHFFHLVGTVHLLILKKKTMPYFNPN